MDEIRLAEHGDRPMELFAFEADEVNAGLIAHNPNIQHQDIMYITICGSER